MTIRVPLDGDNWAEVKAPADIKGADIDDWEEIREKLREELLGPEPEPEPDPGNPAVMKAPERRAAKWTAADLHRFRDAQLGLLITGWSYDLPLPYTTEARKVLPGRACRALEKAADAAAAILNDAEDDEPGPKPESRSSTGTAGFSATSPESTGSPLPVSPPGLSVTASG